MKLPEIFIAIDLETTGLDFEHDEIIEVALVRFEQGIKKETAEFLIKPKKELRPFIEKLTGITKKDLESAKTFAEVAGDIRKFIGEYPLVAHNASFDYRFLKDTFSKVGIEINSIPVIDTLTLSRIAFQEVPNHKLETLITKLNIKRETAHRALPDAIACGELLIKAVQKLQEENTDVLNILAKASKGKSLATIFDDSTETPCKDIAFSLSENESFTPAPKVKAPTRVATFFGANGKLASVLENYKEREMQTDFSQVVERNMHKGGLSVLEASTGMGKSLAYLIPAAIKAINGDRVVVSTATKTLQEQLFKEELPVLQKLFGESLQATILKGRNNYICLRKFYECTENISDFLSPEEVDTFLTLVPWISKTTTGDISENIGFNPKRNHLIWKKFASEASTCAMEKCPFYNKCPALKAKRKATASNLIFVNHSLVLSDLQLDFALLPSYEHIIFDEAHRLPTFASFAQTRSVKFFDLKNINRILMQKQDSEKGLLTLLKEKEIDSAFISELKGTALECEKLFHRYLMKLGKKLSKLKGETLRYKQSLALEFDIDAKPLLEKLNNYKNALNKAAELLRIKNLELFAKNFDGLYSALSTFISDLEFLIQANRESFVFYMEEPFNPHTIRLQATPLESGNFWREKFYKWISSATFTSATLSVKGTLDYFVERMAMTKVPASKQPFLRIYPQAFKEENRSVTLASFLPKPNEKEYQNVLNETLAQVLPDLNGNAMVLFTSINSMLQAQKALENVFLQKQKLLLCQNTDGTLENLVEIFRKEKSACLLGCQTLWEGINLPGDALEYLIIPKLPFPNPSDPLVQAINDKLKSEGKNPFKEYFIPEAFLGLRQGLGRLIRNEEDHGKVLILDSRILSEAYGKTFTRLWNNKHLVANTPEEALHSLTTST